MAIVEHIGQRVKAVRMKRGWSQEQLAKRAQISRGYLARLEIGRHDPAISTVEKLARALHVKITAFLK